MRRYPALLVALFMFAAFAALTLTTPAEGLLKVQCKPSVGLAQVDPIVAHNVPQSSHVHNFFGNSTLLTLAKPESATFDDLVGKATKCANTGDTAAYWVPALLINGKATPADRFIAYYRSFDHKTTGAAEPFPSDMRLVTDRYNWTCGQGSTMSNPVQTIPDCSKSSRTTWLTMHVDFPSCWDGQMNDHTVTGNTADFAPSGVSNHLAFYVKGSPSTCPAGFPVKLPELRETVSWGNGSPSFWTGKTTRLTSDAVGAPAGSSTHADFFNAWVPAELQARVTSCINPGGSKTNCG